IRDLEVNSKRPTQADFEIPEGFRLGDYVSAPPWEYEVHEPVEVTIDCDPEYAWLVARELRVQAAERFVVTTTNVDALVAWCAGTVGKAWIVGPEEAKARMVRHLEATVQRHERPVS